MVRFMDVIWCDLIITKGYRSGVSRVILHSICVCILTIGPSQPGVGRRYLAPFPLDSVFPHLFFCTLCVCLPFFRFFVTDVTFSVLVLTHLDFLVWGGVVGFHTSASFWSALFAATVWLWFSVTMRLKFVHVDILFTVWCIIRVSAAAYSDSFVACTPLMFLGLSCLPRCIPRIRASRSFSACIWSSIRCFCAFGRN